MAGHCPAIGFLQAYFQKNRVFRKIKGAADRHIGCAQHDRPSTGGGGKGWPVATISRDAFVCSCSIGCGRLFAHYFLLAP
jgi:hypothetical protein